MSKLEFKVGKKYKTRGGQTVECVAVWSRPSHVGYQSTFLDSEGFYFVARLNGTVGYSPDDTEGHDIVEQLPDIRTVEGYVLVFPDGITGSLFYATEEECKELTERFGVKIVKVTGTYEASESAPNEIVGWVNVYPSNPLHFGGLFLTEEEAKLAMYPGSNAVQVKLTGTYKEQK